jgi:hypothetical protein
MNRPATLRPARRLLSCLPAVAAAVLLMSAPAAAWGAKIQVTGNVFNAVMDDSQMMVVANGQLHFLYQTDTGVTYRRTDMDVVPTTQEALMEFNDDLGDADGIAADGNLMAIVYRMWDGGPSTLRIRMGHNGGVNWDLPKTLASDAYDNWMGSGSVAIAGQTVVVAWTDVHNGHVNLRRSTDGGVHFGHVLQLGTTRSRPVSYLEAQVQLAASGSRVVATWYARQGTNYNEKQLVSRRSDDSGATFHASQTLDAGNQDPNGPSIAMAGKTVLIFHTTGTGRALVLRSTNGGKTFTSKDLSGTVHSDDRTDIAIDPSNASEVRAVWSHAGKMYLRRSSDGGKTWSAREDTLARADPYAETQPNVAVLGSKTVVAWNGYIDRSDAWEVILARKDG